LLSTLQKGVVDVLVRISLLASKNALLSTLQSFLSNVSKCLQPGTSGAEVKLLWSAPMRIC
jgi:hypothetical protein